MSCLWNPFQIDKDKDGFVSIDEFLTASKGDEFDKDEGWKSVEEERPYTDEELAEFEKQLQEEEKAKMATHDQGAVGGNTAGDIAKVVFFLRQVFYMQRVFFNEI